MLFRIPWVDRETLTKKIERLQKEILILQHKYEETTKKDSDEADKEAPSLESLTNYQVVDFSNYEYLTSKYQFDA